MIRVGPDVTVMRKLLATMERDGRFPHADPQVLARLRMLTGDAALLQQRRKQQWLSLRAEAAFAGDDNPIQDCWSGQHLRQAWPIWDQLQRRWRDDPASILVEEWLAGTRHSTLCAALDERHGDRRDALQRCFSGSVDALPARCGGRDPAGSALALVLGIVAAGPLESRRNGRATNAYRQRQQIDLVRGTQRSVGWW